jgi:hypothetical protein
MPEGWSRSITDAEIVRIATDIDRQGYGTLDNCISEAELQPIRSIDRAAVNACGGEYVLLTGLDAFAGTALSELSCSAAFKDLCRRLFELAVGDTPPEVNFYQTFNSELGETGAFLPQAARQTAVEGRRVGARQRLTDDVAAVKGREVEHRREKQRGLSTLLGALHERFP